MVGVMRYTLFLQSQCESASGDLGKTDLLRTPSAHHHSFSNRRNFQLA